MAIEDETQYSIGYGKIEKGAIYLRSIVMGYATFLTSFRAQSSSTVCCDLRYNLQTTYGNAGPRGGKIGNVAEYDFGAVSKILSKQPVRGVCYRDE